MNTMNHTISNVTIDQIFADVRVAFEWCQHENLIKTAIQ